MQSTACFDRAVFSSSSTLELLRGSFSMWCACFMPTPLPSLQVQFGEGLKPNGRTTRKNMWKR